MIGDLFVCHVAGLFPGHVAAAAVRLIRVVLADESRLSVAGKTSASKVCDSLFGWRRSVRVVTSDTGKPVSAFFLALALQQSFPLTGCSALGTQLARVNKVSYVIGEILARQEHRQGTSGRTNRSLALEVTLQANRVSLAWR